MEEKAEEKPVLELTAAELQPNMLYLTQQSRARYYCTFLKLDPMKDRVMVKAYYPNHAEWREVFVPTDYRFKELTKDEQQKAYEEISRQTKDTRDTFAKSTNRKPKGPGKGRERGVVSGLGMLESWGKYFSLFAHEQGMRNKIKDAMDKEFPNKLESVARWLDAYRGYYNKGRLPGVTKPEQEITKEEWLSDVPANGN